MQTLKNRLYQFFIAGGVILLGFSLFLFTTTPRVFGNASLALATCSTGSSITSTLPNGAPITLGTGSATTSVTYLTTGVGTTTLNCDMGVGNASLPFADGATILIQQAGSSTASTLSIDVQYSQDGVDWYADNLAGMGAQYYATTSPALGPVEQYNFTFASSTINRGVVTNANSATSTRVIYLENIPTRFVRVVYSSPVGSTPLAFWSELRGRKQERN